MKYLSIGTIALSVPLVVSAQSVDACPYMMNWGGGWGGWGIIFPLFWLFVFGGIIAIIAKGLTKNFPSAPYDKNESPLDILQRRYAKGEITREKFEEMKRDIGK